MALIEEERDKEGSKSLDFRSVVSLAIQTIFIHMIASLTLPAVS